MIHALDRRIAILAFVTLIIGLVIGSTVYDGATDPATIWSRRALILLAINILIALLGVRVLFRIFHFLTFARFWWYPAVNGEWDAEIRSNWPQVKRTFEAARRKGDRFDPLADDLPLNERQALTHATATISSSLFLMTIELQPTGTERFSRTLFVRPSWPKPDAPELSYVYEQFDPGPIAVTDTKSHYGAGHLIYNAKQDQFAGEYWTQRNGDRGLNTAGTLILRRRGRVKNA